MVVLAEQLDTAGRALEQRSVELADDVRPYATDPVLLSGGRTASTAMIPEVKHQLLLCHSSYVPGLLLDWGIELALDNARGLRDIESAALRAQAKLAAAIFHIRPLAAAIRQGILATVPTASSHRLRGRGVDQELRQGPSRFSNTTP